MYEKNKLRENRVHRTSASNPGKKDLIYFSGIIPLVHHLFTKLKTLKNKIFNDFNKNCYQ